MWVGSKILLAGCMVAINCAVLAAPDQQMMSEAMALRDQGEFEKATRVMQTWLDQNAGDKVSADDRRTVEFEIERIRRIRQDYQLTRERLVTQLQDRLTTFTESELDAFEREGKLDVQLIDGQKLYANPSASNLLFREPKLRARRKKQTPDPMYKTLFEQMLTAKKAVELTSLSLVLPQDFLVTYTLSVKPDAAPEGKIVRAWLPFMRSFPYHADAQILASSPSPDAVAPNEYPHRTVYFEKQAVKEHPTEFTLSFIYRSWARVNNPDPKKVRPYDKTSPEYAYYTAERKPHIDFSNEELKRISNEVSTGDRNPLLHARRIYDWIANNTIYQYAREYSTLDNISQYTAVRRAGDCGQHAMLFIALCRMNGIPARWTSGWESYSSRGQGMHDWCEFYVEPYGWLPADPDMAVNVLNYADELTTGQRQQLVDYMFGNLDNRRLTVNSDYGMPLYPDKSDFRSETVDFQRGEVEVDGKNLYFDQWDYKMRIEPVTAQKAEALRKRFVPKPVAMPKPTPTPTPKPEPTPTPKPEPTKTPAPETKKAAEDTSTTASAGQANPSAVGTDDKRSTAPVTKAIDKSSTKPATADDDKATSPSEQTKKASPTPKPKPEPAPTPKPAPTPQPKPAKDTKSDSGDTTAPKTASDDTTGTATKSN